MIPRRKDLRDSTGLPVISARYAERKGGTLAFFYPGVKTYPDQQGPMGDCRILRNRKIDGLIAVRNHGANDDLTF